MTQIKDVIQSFKPAVWHLGRSQKVKCIFFILAYVQIELKLNFSWSPILFTACKYFIKKKKKFKIESHNIIYTFKNYFVTVFLVFSNKRYSNRPQCEFGKHVLRVFQFTHFFSGFRALFTELTSTFFSKNNFKIESHNTIHIFKNYFTTIFSIINNIQIVRQILVWGRYDKL